MRRMIHLSMLISLLSFTSLSHAFGLSDIMGSNDQTSATSELASNPLTQMITSQLGVSTQQAAGGTGALLAMAANQLSGGQNQELTKLIPKSESLTGSVPAGLGGLLNSQSGVNQVFSALGMNSGMVSQFVPIILKYLGSQGASSGLLNSLSSLWTPAK
ncbi:DUF2780 domain-containing protein [Dongshaea marina]|uniref:DUF2780 domain-containing protein n=1 Tax=Dongshaea marina TaxID=2047966 RepID=UPI00190110E0|nr:DUF2780 domain-containing protein [Dongshaea marina]